MGGGVSCGEHSDYGCVTLLLADDTRGALQVRGKDGGWIAADPVPGMYVVNIGDMLELWTGGRWRSTRHRVVHGGGGYRVSVPFFWEPDWDARYVSGVAWGVGKFTDTDTDFGGRIKPLDCCVGQTQTDGDGEGDGEGEARYKEVVYGEHLLGKVLGNFYSEGAPAPPASASASE